MMTTCICDDKIQQEAIKLCVFGLKAFVSSNDYSEQCFLNENWFISFYIGTYDSYE